MKSIESRANRFYTNGLKRKLRREGLKKEEGGVTEKEHGVGQIGTHTQMNINPI